MKEVGESALEAALPWDRIAGVPFKTSAGTAAAPRHRPALASPRRMPARSTTRTIAGWSDIAANDRCANSTPCR